MNTHTASPLDFDFPAFPVPRRVNVPIAELSPAIRAECRLVAKRCTVGLTDAERVELAEVLETIAREDEAGEARRLHNERHVNFHE